jgi:hypothetical protein
MQKTFTNGFAALFSRVVAQAMLVDVVLTGWVAHPLRLGVPTLAGWVAHPLRLGVPTLAGWVAHPLRLGEATLAGWVAHPLRLVVPTLAGWFARAPRLIALIIHTVKIRSSYVSPLAVDGYGVAASG